MVTVIKATGEEEPFSEEKLIASIKRAAIPEKLHKVVCDHVKSKLYNKIPTSEIYRHITEFLGNSQYAYAKTRYSLKQAIMDLGPTGYPFEDYIARILQWYGYKTQVRVKLVGKCVSHEIDVVAKKGSHKIIAEAKFHNQMGIKTDIHVSLYTKARFDDLLQRNDINQVWLITNTKLSLDAITYAICMNMKVTSWNYPEGESLRDLINQSGLLPVTALSNLSQKQKQILLDQHIVLCRDICQNPTALNALSLSDKEKQTLLAEASYACNLTIP